MATSLPTVSSSQLSHDQPGDVTWPCMSLGFISYGKNSCRSILHWAIVNIARCCKASTCLLLGTDKMLFLFWKVFMLPLLPHSPMEEWSRGRTSGWLHILLDLSSSLRASHILLSLGLFFWDRLSLCSLGRHGTHSNHSPSAFWVLRFQAWATMPGFTSVLCLAWLDF